MEAISVPSPPRFVPTIRALILPVNPDNNIAAGTLLITWLAATAHCTSCPAIILSMKPAKAGILPRFPMNMNKAANVPSRE